MAVSNAKWIEIHRKAWLNNAKTPMQTKFGTDKDVKWFCIEYSKFVHGMDRNAASEKDVTYRDWAMMICDRTNYDLAKEELEIADEKQLYKILTMLHKKYSKLTMPYY